MIDAASGKAVARMRRVGVAGGYSALLAKATAPFAYRLRIKIGTDSFEIEDPFRFPPLLGEIDLHLLGEGSHFRSFDKLGAHLASGTTVMHEGFCNFNAGTLGASMVEGRISAGVVVGDGSDIGGGASIMGTLSGGGKEVVSIGERCLLGANAGIGISLGDECIVEAGLYVTGGSLVTLPDGEVVKGRTLSGASGLLFRRNSVTGAIEATQRSGNWGGLNAALHKN